MRLANFTSHPTAFSITPTSPTPAEVAWRNLHHAGPVLLRAIEISYAGGHSLRVLGHPSAGEDDFSTLWHGIGLKCQSTSPRWADPCILPMGHDGDHESTQGMWTIGTLPDSWTWSLTCPCGYLGDPTHECSCTLEHVERWRTRLSRHSFDISLVIALPRAKDLAEVDRARKGLAEPLSLILQRGEVARAHRDTISLDLDGAGNQLLRAAIDRMFFTLSQRDRVVEVAWTITALQGGDRIRAAHVAEAIQYQGYGRELGS